MIQGMHRIVLFCRDTAASKEWYEKVGFRYKHGHEHMHWFAFGHGEIMLHPARSVEATKSDNGDRANFPSFHATVGDLDGLFDRVRARGLEPYDHQSPGEKLKGPVTRPWGQREFELQDPDGHRWAFNEDDPS